MTAAKKKVVEVPTSFSYSTELVGQVAKAISAISLATSPDLSRPVLHALCFEWHPEGVTIVATDSYWLAYAKLGTVGDAEPLGTTLIEDHGIIVAFLKACGPRQGTLLQLHLTADASKFTADLGDTSISVPVISGKYQPYPDWKKIVAPPADAPFPKAAFNQKFLARICRVAATVGAEGGNVHLELGGEGKPMRFSIINGVVDVAGCLMPIRWKS